MSRALEKSVAAVVRLVTGLETILAHQAVASGPRPIPLPYATVDHRQTFRGSATPGKRMTDTASGDKFELERALLHESVIRISVLGPDATAIANGLRLGVHRQDAKDLQRTEGIKISHTIGPILDIVTLRDTAHEEHVQVDFLVRSTLADIEPLEDIQTVDPDITYA